jgi:hypothetical protein
MHQEHTGMSQNSRRHAAEGSACPVILDLLERTIEGGDISAAWASAVSNDITEIASFAFFQQPVRTCPDCHELLPQVCSRTFLILLAEPDTISTFRRCTFSLETLFLPDHLDLKRWIPQQKDLIHIGLYITRRMQADPEQLSGYKTLLQQSNPERGMTLYSITQEGTHMDTVHAYPAFAHRWTAESIAKSMAHVMPPEWITCLDLHLMNLSDHDVVGPIISSVARFLPRIIRLRFVVCNRDIHLVRPSSFLA